MGILDMVGDLFGYDSEKEALEQAQQRYSDLQKGLNDMSEYEYIEGTAPQQYTAAEDVVANTVSEDPQLRETELKALQGLKARADEGMTTADTADWMKKRNAVNTEARGTQEAIMDSMSRRGMGGGGTEYALRMGAGQSAIDRLAQDEADKAASNAELRALAELKGGQMAGQMRGEDFNVSSSNADILNNFALQNSKAAQRTREMNTELANSYNQNELAERRGVQKGNVDLDLNKLGVQSGIAANQASGDLAKGVGAANLYSNIGKQAGDIIGGLTNTDEENKKNKWSIW